MSYAFLFFSAHFPYKITLLIGLIQVNLDKEPNNTYDDVDEFSKLLVHEASLIFFFAHFIECSINKLSKIINYYIL